MKTAKLEAFGGLIRVFEDGKSYGDPYEYVVAYRVIESAEVEIVGAIQSPTPSQWRAIRTCLAEAGYQKAKITRMRPDGSTEVRFIKLVTKEGVEPSRHEGTGS